MKTIPILLLCFFLSEINAQEQVHKKTHNYLIKDGMYKLSVEVHLKYRTDKYPVIKVVDAVAGVDYILNSSIEKYQFPIYIAEAYDRKWVINKVIDELDKYFVNKK